VNKLLLCMHCDEVLLKHMGDQIKLRGKIIIFRDNEAFTVCPGCRSEVQVPVSIDLQKNIDHPTSVSSKLYVESTKKSS
jgi:hypothetical protein